MKGLAELALAAMVLVATATRTPAGALVGGAVAWAQGRPGPDLLASFQTGLPESFTTSMATAAALPPVPAAAGASAPPAAVQTALRAALGPQAAAEIQAELDRGRTLEAALEQRAVGVEARSRAIRRATAAGAARPRRYQSHRRFLPDALQRRADTEVAEVLALATVLDLGWPVAPTARITSPFGERVHPVLGTRKRHEGVDIAVPIGTPVHAAGAGRVQRARTGRVSGKYVVIDHGHGVSSNYCHADALHVAAGDQVAAGAHILDSGNTGRSTGPHLHFGLRLHGRAIDPGLFHRSAAGAAPPS